MKNKQTAVNWLLSKHPALGNLGSDIITQALEMEREQMIDLVQSLKDYTRESNNILGYDDREAYEFVDIYFTQTFASSIK